MPRPATARCASWATKWAFIPAWFLIFGLCPACVERKLFIRSDPPGAEVCLSGRKAGQTPLTVPFDYYGTRDVEMRLDGCKAVRKHVEVPAPWYQYFPLDLFTDLLWPGTIEDVHEVFFVLEPYSAGDLGDRPGILERADRLRYGEFTRYGEADGR